MDDLHTRVSRLEESTAKHAEALASLSTLPQTLKDLTDAVKGDPEWGHTGIVPRVTSLEARVDNIELRFNRLVWMMVGSGAGAGGVA